MSSDLTDVDTSTTPSPRVLSPRAALALLSLQLRATQQEAEAAEAQADAIDTDAALEQLRAKLQPRLEERRAALAAALQTAQRESTMAVAAAHREAATIVADARRQAEERRAAAAAAAALVAPEPLDVGLDDLPATPTGEVEVVVATDATAAAIIDETPVDETPVDETPVDETPVDAVAPEVPVDATPQPLVWWPVADIAGDDHDLVPVELPLITPAEPTGTVHFTEFARRQGDVVPAPWAPPQTPMNVVVDAEAFAKVFATVLASVLAERGGPAQPMPMYVPFPPAAPAEKPGFWSNAKHLDVLLLFVAMVIVLMILVAWLA
jgi:hypothetical protein